MLQVIQDVRRGRLSVATIPEPLARPGHVLIANSRSIISAGTEKMVLELASKSLLGKARERPDHVRRVLEKLRNEGFFSTIRQVLEKLDEPMTMGYASAGVVLTCGAGVQDFKPGDRVASNGPHAGVVCVPKHLCARVPDAVPFDQAAFTVLGAIALQGVRLARVGLGDTAFVIGLGLIGQIAVALLCAQRLPRVRNRSRRGQVPSCNPHGCRRGGARIERRPGSGTDARTGRRCGAADRLDEVGRSGDAGR